MIQNKIKTRTNDVQLSIQLPGQVVEEDSPALQLDPPPRQVAHSPSTSSLSSASDKVEDTPKQNNCGIWDWVRSKICGCCCRKKVGIDLDIDHQKKIVAAMQKADLNAIRSSYYAYITDGLDPEYIKKEEGRYNSDADGIVADFQADSETTLREAQEDLNTKIELKKFIEARLKTNSSLEKAVGAFQKLSAPAVKELECLAIGCLDKNAVTSEFIKLLRTFANPENFSPKEIEEARRQLDDYMLSNSMFVICDMIRTEGLNMTLKKDTKA